jgi:hypothetical protein
MFKYQFKSENNEVRHRRMNKTSRGQDTRQKTDQRLSVAGLAKRLFQNPEIRHLAQAELDLAAQSEEELAAPVRRGDAVTGSKIVQPPVGDKSREFVPPPDFDNIRDPRQYKQQYSDWIEYKRRQRERRRFMQQVRLMLAAACMQ